MKPVKKAIILCWIMLVACFILKLFGGNWFEVICTNEHFIYICDFIDSHLIIKYLIAFTIYVPQMCFLLTTISKIFELSKTKLLTLNLLIISVWMTNFISIYIKTVLEFFIFLICPILLRINCFKDIPNNLKKYWYYGFVGYFIDLAFQGISLITKNIGIKIVDDSTLISLILMIDYYIMIILFNLYIRKERKK